MKVDLRLCLQGEVNRKAYFADYTAEHSSGNLRSINTTLKPGFILLQSPLGVAYPITAVLKLLVYGVLKINNKNQN
jgi:hypothetical protein